MLFLHDLYTYIVPIFLANFIVGIISWPLSYKFFNKLADKGYAAAHILGWVFIALILFTLGIYNSQLFPLNIYTLRFVCGIWLMANIAVFILSKLHLSKSLIKTVVVTQIIFFALLAALTFIKGSDGNIYRGERLMNFAVLNALQNTDKLPLVDFWLSGNTLNYYYFGHFIGYVILSLANVSIFNGFFILEAWLFATLALNIFNLGKLLFNKTIDVNNKALSNISGLLSVFFILISGSFYTVAWVIKSIYNKVIGNEIYGFPNTFSIGYIKGTITEIPIISFLIQELHAHTWDLLIITLILTILVLIWFNSQKLKYYILLGVLLGIVYMTNPWDLLTYAALIILVSAIQLPIKLALIYVGCTLAVSFITVLPFISYFTSPVTQLGLVMDHTPLIKWLVLWGPFALITGAFILISHKNLKLKNYSFYYLILSLLTLIFVATEQVYFKDINAGSMWYRGNTVFKFWYQIWFLWALIAGPMTVSIATQLKSKTKRWFFITGVIGIVIMQSLYILIMLQVILANPYKGMANGFAWWEEKYPYDYQAYIYLQNNVLDKPVIIEGTNPTPYKDSKFFSAALNWNSVMGMPTHEVTWHNNSKEVWQRINDVEEFYKGTNPEITREIIEKYKVNYAILGELETIIYGNELQAENIESLGIIFYKNDKTTIVKFN